eukprot:ANDGO_01027.mRNA.1 putative metallohydrolase YodQ
MKVLRVVSVACGLFLILAVGAAAVDLVVDMDVDISAQGYRPTDGLRSRLQQWVSTHMDARAERLGEWIRAAPLQGKETAIQNLIMEDLRKLDNFSVSSYTMDLTTMRSSKYFHSPRTDFSSSPIVIGEYKSTMPSARQIILNGHVDVVPAPYEDAFSGSYENGRVHGRGSTDMLGGIMCNLMAVQALQELKRPLKGSIVFQSVVEEESGGAGTLSTLLAPFHSHWTQAPEAVALIPEPSNMELFSVQQGSTWFRISVKGKTAHGASRYHGVSAIEKSMVVLQAILHIEKQRNEKLVSDPLFSSTLPIPSPINVGRLGQCGEWPSSVASSCILEGRLGVLVGEDLLEARATFETMLFDEVHRRDHWFVSEPEALKIEFFGAAWPSGGSPPGHPMIKILRDLEMEEGRLLDLKASPWATDGGYLSAVGGIPALVIGPGDSRLAHQAGESVSMDSIGRCAVLYALAIDRYLGI